MGEETREEDAVNKENNIVYIRQGDTRDGYAEILINADSSSALAAFFPPSPGGSFLTYANVASKLADFGITTGVLHDSIQDALFKANSTHKPVKNCLIAQSSVPITEIPEHFIIRKDLLERKPEIDPNAARIDWHSISAFSIVQTKEPIARRVPKVDGVPGINIYGQEIPFAINQMTVFSAGSNVIAHEKGLFAGKSGRLSIDSKGVIQIEDVLVLKKGVDFTTGNITFPGDVILQGRIADGFKIYSGGSLIASDIVDATEIVCKKDMIVQSGIEGRAKGAVRIGGSLTAKYIQNCRVAVRGDIHVSGSIVLSKIYSMGTIFMGDTGKLVGCDCIVIGGVQALEIGSPREAKTVIRCGTDFTVQQELDIANEQLKQITLQIQKAKTLYEDEPTQELAKNIEELLARKTEIANKIPLFLPKIDTNEEAFIEVHGTIYPGTEIEICHVPYKILKPQKQVVFKLDKAKGIIVSKPFKKN